MMTGIDWDDPDNEIAQSIKKLVIRTTNKIRILFILLATLIILVII